MKTPITHTHFVQTLATTRSGSLAIVDNFDLKTAFDLKKVAVALWLAIFTLSLSGCQTPSTSESARASASARSLAPALPSSSSSLTENATPPPTGWLKRFNNPALEQAVGVALDNNFDINTTIASVEAARQQTTIAKSSLWPSVGLEVSGQKSKNNHATAPSQTYSTQYSANAVVSWELDLWGKLRDSGKAADYRYLSEQSTLAYLRLSLAGQVAQAWYNAQTAQQLERLIEKRINNLTTNLDIIESGYRQGINQALDVYLARSDLATERNNLQAQQALRVAAVRQLQLLLGQYPSGQLTDSVNMSTTGYESPLPAPAALDLSQLNARSVAYRFDLQATYLQLLASDRDLAVAHKQRFPSFNLTAAVGDSSDELHNLLDTRSLAWNVLANLSQPLFAAGRLKAAQEQQRQQVIQNEQQYLKALYTAFSEVEQAITNERALVQQVTQIESAQQFAEAAATIAFDEYRQGLSSYTAVLEAQRRAFSTQNTLITLQNQLLQNRIQLMLALGGHYH